MGCPSLGLRNGAEPRRVVFGGIAEFFGRLVGGCVWFSESRSWRTTSAISDGITEIRERFVW